MADTEALARVLCAADGEDPDKVVRGLTQDRPAWTFNREQAERIVADPGPLLAALAEAGVLTEVTRESYEIVADVDGERVYQHHSDDPRYLREQLTMHPRRYRPGSRVERGVTRWFTTDGVTDWQEDDRA